MLTVKDNQLRTNFLCKELKIIQMGDVHTKDPTTLFTFWRGRRSWSHFTHTKTPVTPKKVFPA